MQATKKRPAPPRQGPGKKQKYFRHPNHNTKTRQISTNLAQKVFHDLHAILERKPVRLVHLQPDPRGAS